MDCSNPFMVRRDGENAQEVPCGKCYACFRRRVSHWSFRLMNEEKVSTSAHFITLTYDWTHIPFDKKGNLDLFKRDLQLFFKRLRKSHPPGQKPIKYYGVGEYGGRTKRPHYHAIIFNADIELMQDAWKCTTTRKLSSCQCSCGKHLGMLYYGDVNYASVGYVLKYLSKTNKLKSNDTRTKPFNLISKGMGIAYLTTKMVNWHKSDVCNHMYGTLPGGQKIGLPRYYKDKIYTSDERQLAATVTYEKMLVKRMQKEFKTLTVGYRRNNQNNNSSSEKRLLLIHQTQML